MSDPYYVTALKSGSVWANNGTGVTLNYKFWTETPSYYGPSAYESQNFQAFTAAMKTATQEILAHVSTFANITFQEVASNADAKLGFAQAQLDPGAGAWAYYPGNYDMAGDVWTNNLYASTQNMTKGGYGYFVLIHELGHALGLKHSFEAPNALTGAEDSTRYTVMSYTTTFYNIGYMLYDIAALQSLYGANMNHATGNTNYVLQSGYAYTIWDAGGTDTLDGSATSAGIALNLNAGTYSSVGGNQNIAIAYNVTIENAIGGSGNDVFYDNSANNTITCNSGNDTINCGAGNDTVNGGDGTDSAIYSVNFTGFTVATTASNSVTLTQSAIGTDVFTNVENFTFNGQNYSLAQLQAIASVLPALLCRFSWSGGSYNLSSAQSGTTSLTANNMNYIPSPTLSVEATRSATDQLALEINHAAGAPAMALRLVAGTGGLNVDMSGTHSNLNIFFMGNAGSDSFEVGDTTLTGKDLLIGAGGNDTFKGGRGADRLDGGEGNDTLSGGYDNDTIVGGAGTDSAVWEAASTSFLIFRNTMGSLIVKDASDIYRATGGIGVFGMDTVTADVEELVFNDVTLNVAALNLTAGGVGWGGGTLYYDALNNMFAGTAAADTVYGAAGNDALRGMLSNDTLYGDDGNDILDGGEGSDQLYGGAHNDRLSGSNGNDTLEGGLGTDTLTGGAGTDTVVWDTNSAGFVIFRLTNGAYVVLDTNNLTVSGYGADTVATDVENFEFSNISGTFASLGLTAGGAGWGTAVAVYGDANVNLMRGTAAADALYGGGGADTVSGMHGNDALYGEAGNDILTGGFGADIMDGGAGKDTLNGGDGADTYVISVADGNADICIGFSIAGGDKLDISDILTGYNPLTSILADFVRLQSQTTSAAVVAVNQDGIGSDWVVVATVSGSSFIGVTATSLEAGDQLILA